MIDQTIIAHEPPIKEKPIVVSNGVELDENGEEYKQISIFEEDETKK
jgi:hypothetical protein